MTLIIALLLAPLTLLTFCFAVEVLMGLWPVPQPNAEASDKGRAVMIVPAHDEEAVLPRTLSLLIQAASERAHVLVVADNCSDATAEVARQLGAEAVERFNAELRGKGFALDFARDQLTGDPPDVVLIVDADCRMDEQSVATLIDVCAGTRRPCQATNLQMPQPNASPPVQLSTFAFFVKNVIRQRGLQRLAGRAHLAGTGVALPWPIFAKAELASSNIVEDLKLGQDLSAAGHAPIFVEQSSVWSDAETQTNTMSQRRRWEGGFLQNAIHTGPRMLGKAIRLADAQLLWAAIDTMIPPFALLILLDSFALLLGVSLSWIGSAQHWPLLILVGSLMLALLALALAWSQGGARFVSLTTLARAPFYIAWKLPMYVALAFRGVPKEWVRTAR